MMNFRQLNFLPHSEKITLAMQGYYSDYLTEVFVTRSAICFPKIDGYLLAQNGASLLGAIIIAPLIEEVVFRG